MTASTSLHPFAMREVQLAPLARQGPGRPIDNLRCRQATTTTIRHHQSARNHRRRCSSATDGDNQAVVDPAAPIAIGCGPIPSGRTGPTRRKGCALCLYSLGVVDTGKQRQVELSFRSIGATGEYLSGEMSLTNMLAELDGLMPDLVLPSPTRSEIVALENESERNMPTGCRRRSANRTRQSGDWSRRRGTFSVSTCEHSIEPPSHV